MKTALTIAGSDPSGGAGLQADLRVFEAFGLHGLSVPSSLTAQNTEGVFETLGVQEGFFKKQLDVLLADIRPDALKTGMLLTPHAVEAAAEAVKRHSLANLVVDPVTVSSSGKALSEEGALDSLRDFLVPISRLVTPNIYEASLLTGIGISGPEDMERAAMELKKMGPEAVIVTGGHLEGLTVDVFWDGTALLRLESRKIEGQYHGTGCVFSAALTALLALGRTPVEAARGAKDFIQNAIKKAFHPGRGMGILRV